MTNTLNPHVSQRTGHDHDSWGWISLKRSWIMFLLPALAVMAGCDPVVDPEPSVVGPKGIYVVNEGSFTASNAELSYIAEDRVTVSGNVFSTTNPGHMLGDIAQDATVAEGKLYVVVNNSRKVEVVEAGTHRRLHTITLSRAPRAIRVVSPLKAYVTNMDSTVSVVNLVSRAVTKDIVVGAYPEGLTTSGERLYVFNSSWGSGTSISVIDVLTDTVVRTIQTPPGPTYGVLGRGGILHVLCTGSVAWAGAGPDTPGSVLTIEAATGAVLDTLPLSQPAVRMAGDAAGDLYVTVTGNGGSGVWKLSGGSSPAVVSKALVSGVYYGIGVDMVRSELYLAEAGDFVGHGTVKVHTLSGAHVRTYTAGIGVAPNGFVFLP